MSDDEKVVYEITFDLPGTPKGQEVMVAGLGTFANGSTYEVTEEEAESYRSYHTSLKYEYDKDNNLVGATAEPGPTLLQAFSKTDGVDVNTVQSKTEDKKPVPPDDKNSDGGVK
jgi:hypothetical protein